MIHEEEMWKRLRIAREELNRAAKAVGHYRLLNDMPADIETSLLAFAGYLSADVERIRSLAQGPAPDTKMEYLVLAADSQRTRWMHAMMRQGVEYVSDLKPWLERDEAYKSFLGPGETWPCKARSVRDVGEKSVLDMLECYGQAHRAVQEGRA